MVHWQSTDGFPNGIVVTFEPGGAGTTAHVEFYCHLPRALAAKEGVMKVSLDVEERLAECLMGFADLAESVEAKGGAGEGEGEWDDGDAVLEAGTVPQDRTGGNRRRGGIQGRAHEGQPEGGTRGGRGVPPEGGARTAPGGAAQGDREETIGRLNDTNAREVSGDVEEGRRAASTRKSARVAAHFLDGQSHCRFPLFQACSASQTPP